MKYKDDQGNWVSIALPSLDSMPVGTIVDYDGDTIPTGWEEANDYSTTEIDTGKKWIDNKPIYRKVFTSPDVNYGTTQTINLGITTIDNIIKIDGYVQRYNAGSSSLSGNYYSINNKYTEIFVKKSTGILTMSIGTEYVHFAQGNCYIEYTKTTD